MKPRDPIIDGLHRLREKIGRDHAFDVHRIAATIRRHEQENPGIVVQPAPRRPARQKKAS